MSVAGLTGYVARDAIFMVTQAIAAGPNEDPAIATLSSPELIGDFVAYSIHHSLLFNVLSQTLAVKFNIVSELSFPRKGHGKRSRVFSALPTTDPSDHLRIAVEDFIDFWRFTDKLILLNLPVFNESLINLLNQEYFGGILMRDLLSKTEETIFAAVLILQDLLRLTRSVILVKSIRQIVSSRSVITSLIDKMAVSKSDKFAFHTTNLINECFKEEPWACHDLFENSEILYMHQTREVFENLCKAAEIDAHQDLAKYLDELENETCVSPLVINVGTASLPVMPALPFKHEPILTLKPTNISLIISTLCIRPLKVQLAISSLARTISLASKSDFILLLTMSIQKELSALRIKYSGQVSHELLEQARENPQGYVLDEPADGEVSDVDSETYATPVSSMLSWITSTLVPTTSPTVAPLPESNSTSPTVPQSSKAAVMSPKYKVADRFSPRSFSTGITALLVLNEMAKETAAILMFRLNMPEHPPQDTCTDMNDEEDCDFLSKEKE